MSRRIYNVVQSIKGGCGKTTFSLMLTAYLANANRKKATCLLDMDFLGTSLVDLFDSTNFSGTVSLAQRQIYLNEKMREYENVSSYLKRFERHNRTFYIGFSSPVQEHKNWFNTDSSMNYIPHMAYNIFDINFKTMFSDDTGRLGGNLNKEVEGELENIVFDMPPSYDGYSDIIRRNILNEKTGIKNWDDITNIFIMINLDITHLYATINYLKGFFASYTQLPDNLFIVFNDNLCVNGRDVNAYFRERQEILVEEMKENMYIPKAFLNRIKFLKCPIYEKYAKMVVKGRGILETGTEDPFEENPVIKYANFYDKDMKNINNQDLYNFVCLK